MVMLVNYVAFYADDLAILYGFSETGLLVYGLRALAFPVASYVAVIEPYTLLPIPVLGRALNYCIEISYFYLLLWFVDLGYKLIQRCIVKPLERCWPHA